MVYILKKGSRLPAIAVELKWNKSSEGTIGQIRDRNYLTILKDYDGEAVMAGINYDAKAKTHSCVVERA